MLPTPPAFDESSNLLRAATFTTAPNRITLITEFSLAPAALFALFADHASMPSWFPFLRHVRMDHAHSRTPNTCDIGSVRICTLTGFGTLRETILAWHPPHGFAYRVDSPSMPFTDHAAIIRIEACVKNGNASTLHWSQHFRDRGLVKRFFCPAGMRWLMQRSIRNLSHCGG